MQSIAKDRAIEVELDALIQFQQTDDAIECVILNITNDYTDVMAVASDPRVCRRGAVDLSIIMPDGRAPVRCAGEIIWYLESDALMGKSGKYLARIFVPDTSRMVQEKLDRLIPRDAISPR